MGYHKTPERTPLKFNLPSEFFQLMHDDGASHLQYPPRIPHATAIACQFDHVLFDFREVTLVDAIKLKRIEELFASTPSHHN